MSSEKQFEKIENKIKEAFENNYVVFEEKSWVKMETLLDKEYNKKPFFWLLFLVPIALLGVYAILMFPKNYDKIFSKNTNNNKIEKTNTIKKATAQIATNENIIQSKEDNTASTIDSTIEKINRPLNATTQIPTSKNKIPNKENSIATNNSNNTTVLSSLNTQNSKIFIASKKANTFNSLNTKNTKYRFSYNVENKGKDYLAKNITKISKTKISIKKATASEDKIVFEKTTSNKKDDSDLLQTTNTAVIEEIKKDSIISIVTKSIAKKEKKKPSDLLSRFYLIGAAGADIGTVKVFSFNNGSFSPKYGASIGFDINKKLRLQSGFYASKKKYVAGPKDYNAKAGTYFSTATITKVEASCLIYELPIVLQFNFLQKKSYSIYAGAGISSYIMKTEDYNYFYKRFNIDYNRAYSYSGNQHLFSNAIFSAGIEKNISKKIILQLEPTIGIPLKGVGEGSVKLYSTSLLLGLKYKPFHKK
jgi:hypothetical protein